jgi:oligopeptide transport system substrate-binding protein
MVYQRETSAFVDAREYIFRHALLREVTYGSVLKRVRRTYHGLVADWLLEHGGERVGEIPGLIADHLALADRAAEAVDYLLQAGDRARDLYAHQEAIRAYERALALLRELGADKAAARTLMKLGLSHDANYDFRRANQAYQQGSVLWQRAEAELPAVSPPPAPHALRVPLTEPTTLDPCTFRDAASAAVIGQLFSGLVQLTPDLDIVPDVAQSWEVSDGGRRYTFHLRGDVVWSDGVPVTAHDYAYAWRRMLDPASGSPMVSELYDVVGARAFHQGRGSREDVGIRAVNDRTLLVELEAPTGYLLHLVAFRALSPVPRHVVEERGSAWARSPNLVGNGPYRLVLRCPGERMVLERNPRYHGWFGGNANRVELIHDVVGTWSAGLALYEGDGLDVLRLTRFASAERNRARQRHAGELVSYQAPGILFLGLNPTLPPFDDLRVRRAFALGIDREQLVCNSTDYGLQYYTGGLVPLGVPGHSPGIALPDNPDQAQRLLAEAGYPDGAGFPTVTALAFRITGPVLEALVDLWREALGIQVDPEVVDLSSFIDRTERELPHLHVGGWLPHYPDPSTFLRGGVNRLTRRWRNETYDELVERAGRGADQAERMKLYGQADRMLMEEAIVVPLGSGREDLLIKPWVSRYPISPFHTSFWKDVVLEPH